MNILLYFFSYVLTLSGFLLGKITDEEHKEIKHIVKYYSIGFEVIFFAILIYLFQNNLLALFGIIGLLCCFVLIEYLKIENLRNYFNIILFGISFFLFQNYLYNKIYFILFLIFVIVFENSFKKFNWKVELINILILIVLYSGNFLLF